MKKILDAPASLPVHLFNIAPTEGRRSLRFDLQRGEGDQAAVTKGCLAGRKKDGTLWARPWRGCERCRKWESLTWGAGLERQVLEALVEGGWFQKLTKLQVEKVDPWAGVEGPEEDS